MRMKTIVIKTAAGDVTADLSWVAGVRGFADEAARWQGPVGLFLGGELVGTVVFSESEARDGGAEWPELSDADIDRVVDAVLGEISTWGSARTPTNECRASLTVKDYTAAKAA
jgi:hypothetical protein